MTPFQTGKLVSLSLCCLSLSFLPHALLAEELTASPHEALLLKRIVEYWKDEDFSLAKRQILDFIAQYEESAFKDHLMAMLGDLYFQEENYKDALAVYTQIESETFKEKSYLKHVKSLFHLGEYEKVEKMTQTRIPTTLNPDVEAEVQLSLLYADALHYQGKHKEALPYFQTLLNTSFREYCLYPLAEGYRASGEYEKAVSFFEELLNRQNAQKDEILFQIASLQSEYDRTTAAKTFLEVANLEGKHRSAAAFNYIALMHESKEFTSLLSASDSLKGEIQKDDLPLFHFFVGSAHFQLKNWNKAIAALEFFVQSEKESTLNLKTALFNLMVCARETEDSSLSDRVLSMIASNFSHDPSYLQSFLIHAQLSKEEGKGALSTEELKKLLELSAEFEEREEVLYQIALLLLEQGEWEISHQALSTFLTQYPQSQQKDLAYRHLLNTSIEAMKKEPDNKLFQKMYVSDLEKLFAEKGILNAQEEQEHRFNLAKTRYELKQTSEALRDLDTFIENYPTDGRLPEAHLMAALCHKSIGEDQEKIAKHLEQVLILDPERENAHVVHLHLYNTYLTLSNDNEKTKTAFLDKAADHLFAAFLDHRDNIKFDNQIWLANYYYSKVKQHKEAFKNPLDSGFLPLQRSIAAYEKILGLKEGVISFPKENDPLLLEGEVLKYADLLTLNQNLPQKIALLETLSKLTAENPNLEWKYQRQSLFELAKTYEAQEDTKKAIELYNVLLENHTPSYLTHAALLQKTRLQFALLPQEDRAETSTEVIDILNQLKDLQIKKQLSCEPIHLEAALEYVQVRVALTAEESKIDKHLFYLRRVREDFTQGDDANAQEYLNSREKYPEKDKLYQMYMSYIDAEMLRLSGEKAKLAGQEEESTRYFGEARQHLNTLLQDTELLTPFLKEKLEGCKTFLQ